MMLLIVACGIAEGIAALLVLLACGLPLSCGLVAFIAQTELLSILYRGFLVCVATLVEPRDNPVMGSLGVLAAHVLCLTLISSSDAATQGRLLCVMPTLHALMSGHAMALPGSEAVPGTLSYLGSTLYLGVLLVLSLGAVLRRAARYDVC